MAHQLLQHSATALLLAVAIQSANARSASVRGDFQRMNPCPSNGERRGPCPGYVADHVIPLCAGGPDHPSNMQWQTIAAGKSKDKQEHAMCRAMKP